MDLADPGGWPQPVDSVGMWEATAGLPEQMAVALDAARAVDLAGLDPAIRRPITEVVVCGMGGSGIAGDVLAALAAPELPVPVSVVRSYALPGSVGPSALVLCVSFSGDTEETLACASAAAARGALVMTVSGGGELSTLAGREKWPHMGVPAGIPQPRAALGALSVPLLVVLERAGLVAGMVDRLAAAVDTLSRVRDRLVRPGSVAEEAARRIGRTVPLVHGAAGPSAVAAQRWKTQVNENAKSPAFFSVQPELCHNEIAGWGESGDVTRQVLTLVTLRHGGEHPQVARRFELVKELMEEVVADVIEVRSDAADPVAALFDLVLVGDFVSLHLAAREGVDPGPVPALDELKQRLAPR